MTPPGAHIDTTIQEISRSKRENVPELLLYALAVKNSYCSPACPRT